MLRSRGNPEIIQDKQIKKKKQESCELKVIYDLYI